MARAVFGALPPGAGAITRVMKQHGLAWPLVVVATRHWQPRAGSKLEGIHLLQLHPGLTYVFSNMSPTTVVKQLRGRKLMHGSVESAAGAANLFGAIQRSIITLRRHELEMLQQTAGSTGAKVSSRSHRARARKPSLEAEHDVRRLLLHQFRHHDMRWPESAQLWMRIVLARHTRYLNEVRRKVTQLLASLCSPVDEHVLLGRAFASAMEQLHDIYDYALLPAYLQSTLENLRKHLPDHQASQAGRNPAQPRVVTQAMAYLRQHAHEPISLRDVALHVKASPAHLSRQFRQASGMTLTQYLHQQRITMACHLLIESSRSIRRIALGTGFGAVEHFHRVFKRTTGLSPLAYRQTHAS